MIGLARSMRWLVYLTTVLVVVDGSIVHAEFIGHYPFAGTTRFAWMLAYIALLCLAAYALGLPDVPSAATGAIWSAVGAVALAAGGISLAQLVLGSALLPRFTVFGSAVVLAPAYAALGVASDRLRRRHEGSDRVALVAGNAEAAMLAAELQTGVERPAHLAVVLDLAAAERAGTGLVDAAGDAAVTVLVLDRAASTSETVVAQAGRLHSRGVRVRTLSLFYDEWLGKLPVPELEQMSLMFDIQELHTHRYAHVKRFLDIGVGLCGLVLLAVAVPAVWLADRVANPGPLFFGQTRVGKGGRTFTMFKFRTMAPAEGPGAWTAVDDDRLGPFGRFLRRTHIDELPQAINILRGDLSVVGPRPEQPHYVDELRDKIPFYDVRHLVKPGLTGWAQVKFRYGASVGDAFEKLQYEFFYLRHQSLVLDARIVARTLRSVLRRQGR